MVKDHSNKSFARSSYEKISKVTFGFSRRISQNPKTNIPNPSQSTTKLPTMNPTASQTPASTFHQPVHNKTISTPKPESFSPREVKPTKRFVRFSSSTIKKSEDKELTANKTFSEEKYNNYIENTKMKMRAPSNVTSGNVTNEINVTGKKITGGRTVSRRESFNDMFSSYINRTKLRLRTTSSVGEPK